MAGETGSTDTVWLVAAFVAGGGIGWAIGGIVPATVGGLVATLAGGLAIATRRVRQSGAALEGPAPDLRGLAPEQALAVLGTVAQGAGAHTLDLGSPQADAVARIRALTDPAEALDLARRLSAEHPRSGLLRAELARQQLAGGDVDTGVRTAGEAIQLALDGGSNPLAVRLLVEFFEHRDGLGLAEASLGRLAGAAATAGHDGVAAWCRGADIG